MTNELLSNLYHDFNLVFNVKSNQDTNLAGMLFLTILEFHKIEESRLADDQGVELVDLLIEFFNAEKIPEFYKFEELMNNYAKVRKSPMEPVTLLGPSSIPNMMHNIARGYAGIPPIQNLDKL